MCVCVFTYVCVYLFHPPHLTSPTPSHLTFTLPHITSTPAGGNPTTGFTNASRSSYGRFHSYSGEENERPPVVRQPTTPTERRAAGQSLLLPSSNSKNYTVGDDGEISDGENGAGAGDTVEVRESAMKVSL